MPIFSDPHSVERWSLVQARLADEIQSLRSKMQELLAPQPVLVGTSALELPRAQSARQSIFALLADLDTAYALKSRLSQQLQRVSHQSGLAALAIRIAGLTETVATFNLVAKINDSRGMREEDLQTAANRLVVLSKAGESEMIKTERLRINEKVFNIPVLGTEDTGDIVSYVAQLNRTLDELLYEQASLRIDSGFALELNEQQAACLADLGIRSKFIEVPAPELPEPEPQPKETTAVPNNVPPAEVDDPAKGDVEASS